MCRSGAGGCREEVRACLHQHQHRGSCRDAGSAHEDTAVTRALTSSRRGTWTAHCRTVAGQHAADDEDVEDAARVLAAARTRCTSSSRASSRASISATERFYIHLIYMFTAVAVFYRPHGCAQEVAGLMGS